MAQYHVGYDKGQLTQEQIATQLNAVFNELSKGVIHKISPNMGIVSIKDADEEVADKIRAIPGVKGVALIEDRAQKETGNPQPVNRKLIG